MEIAHVKEIRQESYSYAEGSKTWKYDGYVVYPGAMVTVLDADMMDDASDGLAHADWAVDTSSGERIDIVDDMEPLEVTPDILGIFDPESSTYVLGFELVSRW